MIKTIIILISLFPEIENQVHVTVENIQSTEGKVYVALYKEGSEFPKDNHYLLRQFKDAREGRIDFIFPKIESGSYAVAVFHDRNNNQKLDTNFLGIPREPYGFSNSFRPKLSAPRFADCVMLVNRDTSIRIKVK